MAKHRRVMKHASLFSGIGGFDLAAQWAGWNNVFNCEIDEFCKKVLKHHFPNSIQYDDIKKTDFTKYKGAIDVVSGGFPCQPFSDAGKRKGTKDNRYLWNEMFWAVRDIEPKWVVAENVYGLINNERGVVFERVQSDLEVAGYEVQSFVIPACSVNAPHKRNRVWIVAYRTNAGIEDLQQGRQNGVYELTTTSDTNSDRCNGRRNTRNLKEKRCKQKRTRVFCGTSGFSKEQITANANSERGEQSLDKCQAIKSTQNIPDWRNFPTQRPVCGRDDGLSFRLDGITFPKWRRESIKAFGNAIVPQIAYQIFMAINKIEKL